MTTPTGARPVTTVAAWAVVVACVGVAVPSALAPALMPGMRWATEYPAYYLWVFLPLLGGLAAPGWRCWCARP